MSAIEFIRPRITVDVPAFLAGALFAYEDLLGTFACKVVVQPTTGDAVLNHLDEHGGWVVGGSGEETKQHTSC